MYTVRYCSKLIPHSCGFASTFINIDVVNVSALPYKIYTWNLAAPILTLCRYLAMKAGLLKRNMSGN